MLAQTGLSKRQLRVLEVIREYSEEYGYPPTIREIGELVGITSTSVVSYNLNVLQNKGYLVRDRDISRGLRLVDGLDDHESPADGEGELAEFVSIPLLGAIAAGIPLPVPESNAMLADAESIRVAREMIGSPRDVYALQVRGDSMIDALINDGDVVLMRHQQTAENGDMIAAWIKDEKATTLKRFYWEPGRTSVRLQPANPLMDPIYVHPANLDIQGKVIGVIRRLG
ncbi:MAG: transcriptional repressor LexA [Chloroflexi bacterium]|nr:transcriptional repressor LexA [Chloroflexota bacterium]